MYQTEYPRPTDREEHKQVRVESDIFFGKRARDVGDFDLRVYKLIENYDPNNLGEGTYFIFPLVTTGYLNILTA